MDVEAQKRQAGEAAAELVKDGTVVGLGTGSTVKYTVLRLIERVADGLDIVGIPTSEATARLARDGGIRLSDLDEHPDVDLTIDGADEVGPGLALIKGGGGALTREKIVARASREMIAVVDASKVVARLGSTFALPIEVIDLGKTPVERLVEQLGAKATLRRAKDGTVYLTDNGHPILDAKWPAIDDPAALERTLCMYPGVVECGLFLDLCSLALVAGPDGVRRLRV